MMQTVSRTRQKKKDGKYCNFLVGGFWNEPNHFIRKFQVEINTENHSETENFWTVFVRFTFTQNWIQKRRTKKRKIPSFITVYRSALYTSISIAHKIHIGTFISAKHGANGTQSTRPAKQMFSVYIRFSWSMVSRENERVAFIVRRYSLLCTDLVWDEQVNNKTPTKPYIKWKTEKNKIKWENVQ